MKINQDKPARCITILPVVTTLIIAVFLAVKTYHINYWPTDSYNPYIPTARILFDLSWLSEMHTVAVNGILRITMRAKEALILGIAVMQRILSDTESLYPNTLFLILVNAASGLLLFEIFRKLYNPFAGMTAFLFFSFCFWPYLYILQGAHQPLVLMNCLAAALLLITAQGRAVFHAMAGIFIGLMLFSSPTSPLYLVYLLAVLFAKPCSEPFVNKNFKPLVVSAASMAAGVLLIALLFTLPHPLKNLKAYIHFLNFSQHGNNFALYREYLTHMITMPEKLRGGGWLWIVKYFMLIMPVLFSLYILSLIYFFFKGIRRPAFFLLILLTLSTPICVEISGVAQFGRNYFSWLPGILLSVTWMFVDVSSQAKSHKRSRLICFLLIGPVLSAHIIHNGVIFFSDVLPSRMATTNIYRWLKKNNQDHVYVYANHPRNINFVRFLNNPKYQEKITPIPINNIREALDGYILIPPVTGKSIFQECRMGDFLLDFYFTELSHTKEFEKYKAASFKTLASSRIWTQEEEICTYIDLMLHVISSEDREKGMALLLDAAKLQEEWFVHFPKILKIR